ncbi:glycosyltransferase [Calothrix sp. FACHB-156]|nr:glycosyltransferase [Calothrix sp. FACHB-156]
MNFTQHSSSNQPEIIVISSVSPQPTSAGQVVLYRHLRQVDELTVSVVPNPKDSKTSSWRTKLVRRLEHTRFHRWSNDLDVIEQGRIWDDLLFNSHKQLFNLGLEGKAFVLTVAHGDGCWAAQKFAQWHQLPLVTIFHDWWPDIPHVHQPLRQLLEQRFVQLYQKSNVALCVSEGMKNTLGSHPNSTVLYPLPAVLESNSVAKIPTKSDKFPSLKVVYSGGLYDYAPMLAELLQVTKEDFQVQVQVRGDNPNWSADFCSEMRDRGLWLDFAPREELNQWLASADAFLVTMSFDPALQRRMETSFPSKLPEYAQFGKPLVIWGPQYCSAVQWGQKGDRALCITEEQPTALVKALERLNRSLEKQKYYARQARAAAKTEFNPHILQNHFLTAIKSLIQ